MQVGAWHTDNWMMWVSRQATIYAQCIRRETRNVFSVPFFAHFSFFDLVESVRGVTPNTADSQHSKPPNNKTMMTLVIPKTLIYPNEPDKSILWCRNVPSSVTMVCDRLTCASTCDASHQMQCVHSLYRRQIRNAIRLHLSLVEILLLGLEYVHVGKAAPMTLCLVRTVMIYLCTEKCRILGNLWKQCNHFSNSLSMRQ